MNVTVNGEKKTFESPLNLYNVLEQQGVVELLIAAAVNGEFVPKTTWEMTDIKEGDVIDVVSPMQGG